MKRFKHLACDEQTHKNIKLEAARKGKKISELLKDTFGNSSEEEMKIGKSKFKIF